MCELIQGNPIDGEAFWEVLPQFQHLKALGVSSDLVSASYNNVLKACLAPKRPDSPIWASPCTETCI